MVLLTPPATAAGFAGQADLFLLLHLAFGEKELKLFLVFGVVRSNRKASVQSLIMGHCEVFSVWQTLPFGFIAEFAGRCAHSP